jgi:hypothetical protein
MMDAMRESPAATDIEIEDAEGQVRRFEPDSMMMAMAGDYAGHRLVDLGEPGPASTISGEPGYRYRRGSLEVVVSRRELQHLVFNALPPTWYRRLRETCPGLPELSATLYDQETGRALQPKVKVPKDA